MVNERKTENIVRNHFKQFLSEIIIEEQKSDNPQINKLLKGASKSGSGSGYPEFIISHKTTPNLLIVVECKANITKHKSESGDKYADYAVDGALLYASYLAREFDVIAIAVSGETTSNLEVSHYLHLKGERSAVPFMGDNLLDISDYINGYLKSPEKFRQDYKTLLSFTKNLNDELHIHKIAEDQRSLLISCIIIALENTAFKNSYGSHKTPRSLAKSLIDTVSTELEEAHIGERKLENLNTQFAFIKTDTSLSTKDQVLKELIDKIDKNINQFIKTHEYFDVLGQLYIEFLRYANNDKGLGIVLTPPHITELFAELAQVNKNSVVFDNCTGTGGFLISAMSKMIADAKGDLNKIKEIKSGQLIGVEYSSKIFALAVSNMYIHQDGKTNILNGSCFDEAIVSTISAKKPTVGLLNPPYQSNKKNDTDEFEFILNNLSVLSDGATCIAIVPMQKAIAQKGKVLEYKKRVLKHHTLEAVLSMPDELFFNSNVGVVSCIMIFTAHKAHPANKESYFGYYKDDGFIKRKIHGRYDAFGKWDSICQKWISNFQNKKEEPGFSVNEVVTASDEWCAEAYMLTDYSILKKEIFEKTLLDYASFLFSNKLVNSASVSKVNDEDIALNTDNWGLFKINELFNISGSRTTSIAELEEYGVGQYPYITTQATNNGVESFYNYYTELGNVLTVDSAVIGYCAYQHLNFSASDHVEKLTPLFDMNKYVAMFLVTIINLEQYRYNYGRKSSQSRMKSVSIKLPQREDGSPDFEFMDRYIKSLYYSNSL
ncbi:MAG: N-6 DNA methylase [Rikenellaceae bacterium]